MCFWYNLFIKTKREPKKMNVKSFAVVSKKTGFVLAEYIHLGFSSVKYEGLTFGLVQQDDNYEIELSELPILETHEAFLSSNKGYIEELELMKSKNPYRNYTVCKDVGDFDLLLCMEPKSFLKTL